MKLKKVLFALSIFLALPVFAEAYSGNYSIWYQPKGAFIPTNANGDTTGFGVARDACIRKGGGVIQIGPGAEGVVFTYPTNANLLILRSGMNGWSADPFVGPITFPGSGKFSFSDSGGTYTGLSATRANIQSYLDRASPTNTIYLKVGPGNVNLDSTLWIHGNTSLNGSGKGVTNFIRSAFNPAGVAFSGNVFSTAIYGTHSMNYLGVGDVPRDSLSNITIADLTVNGNSTAWPTVNPNGAYNFGIFTYFVDGLYLTNVEVHHTLQTGIGYHNCRNTQTIGCYIHDTGQEQMLGTRNGLNFNSPGASTVMNTRWNRYHNVTDLIIRNQKDTAIDLVDCSYVTITGLNVFCDHDSAYGNDCFESDSSVPNSTRTGWVISNVVAKGLAGAFFTNNATNNLDNVSISNVNCIFSATAMNQAAVNIVSTGVTQVTNFRMTDAHFENCNSGNNTGSVYSAGFLWIFQQGAKRSKDITLTNCTFIGSQGSVATVNDGAQIGGKISNVKLNNVKLKNCEHIGFNVVAGANDTTNSVVLDGCYVESAQAQAYIVETAGGLVNDITIRNCVAKDAMKSAGGCSFNLLTYAAGQTIKNVVIQGNKVIRTSGTNMQGLQIRQEAGAIVDSVWVINNDFGKAASNPYLVTGTPTNIFWNDPAASISPARLGPYPGGAIRIIDGTTFPLTVAGVQAAANELPGGGKIILPSGTILNWTTLTLYAKTTLEGCGPLNTLIVRSAGATGDAIREKTAGEGNASGATGIVIKDLSVWGNGSTGNGINLGTQGGPNFNANAYLSDVLVRDFVGDGIRLSANAIHSRDIWTISNTNGFNLISNSGANHFSGLWSEGNTGIQVIIAAPWNTFDHIQIEQTGSAPSGPLMEISAPSGDNNVFNGIYMSFVVNLTNLIVEKSGATGNSYLGIRVNDNGHTYTNTIYDEVWTTGTGAKSLISFRVDGASTLPSYFYDKSSNKVTTFSGPDWTFGAKAVVTDSLRANKGLFVGADFLSKIQANTYTPTRSAESNIDGTVTPSVAQFVRVGNTVTVSGRFAADPTAAATSTLFELSLPVASNLANPEDLSGVAFCGTIAGMGAAIIGSSATDTARVIWISSDTTSQAWSYTYTYTVK